MRVRCEFKDQHVTKIKKKDQLTYRNGYELFVTTMRRKYIPPMMECYQDISVISYYHYEDGKDESEVLVKADKYLKDIHQKVVDTIHPVTRVCPTIYTEIVT